MTDAIQTPEELRVAAAEKIRASKDIKLPTLKHWNYDPCKFHLDVGPQADCDYRACGGDLFAHQRVGVAWAHVSRRGLLADDPGLGKTNVILALLALMKQRGELNSRALIIVQTPSTLQWAQEARRWLRGMHVEAAVGSMKRSERIQRYMANWDVLVVGFHVGLKDRELLNKLGPFAFVASDDVDPLLTPETQTHEMIRELSEGAERTLTINATVLQTRLEQLHAALVPSGGLEVFGDEKKFKRDYVRTEEFESIRGHRRIKMYRNVGVKNIPDLKKRLRPLYLRRRASEVDDVKMPKLMPPSTVWLEMSSLQKTKYTQLKQGVLTLKKEAADGKVTYQVAKQQFMHGQMICAGLPAINEPDGPGASPKLDWLEQKMLTVWGGKQKVVVFAKNPSLVKALEARMVKHGIKVAKVWGVNQNAIQRQAEVQKFWNDPQCRIAVGTTAIERSLNLQCANIVVALDTHLNWARMKQILGRVMRAGSRHDHVYFFTLLMAETQEQYYEDVLAARQAINDLVFEETTGIYKALTGDDLLKLVMNSPLGKAA